MQSQNKFFFGQDYIQIPEGEQKLFASQPAMQRKGRKLPDPASDNERKGIWGMTGTMKKLEYQVMWVVFLQKFG